MPAIKNYRVTQTRDVTVSAGSVEEALDIANRAFVNPTIDAVHKVRQPVHVVGVSIEEKP